MCVNLGGGVKQFDLSEAVDLTCQVALYRCLITPASTDKFLLQNWGSAAPFWTVEKATLTQFHVIVTCLK